MGVRHLSNFGFFSEEGSHSGRIVRAPNDFDDAAVGPAGFNLARFVVSLFLAGDLLRGWRAGRYASDEGAAPRARDDLVSMAQAYAARVAVDHGLFAAIVTPGARAA